MKYIIKLCVLPLILLLSIRCTYKESAKNSLIERENYEWVADWPKLPQELVVGNPTGIGINSRGNIIVFHRADREWPLIGSMPTTLIKSATILIIDSKTGKLLTKWGSNLFIMPHGLTVDHEDNIWVTDVGLNQIFKFNSKGKLLFKLGEAGIAGDNQNHFNKPTDISITRAGEFYVSDGYGNSRVVKFSANGKFLFQWGKKGSKDGEFNIPHAISLDDKGRIYVADRENNRIQVFDEKGKFIEKRTQESFGKITAVCYDNRHQKLIAVDDQNSLFGLKHNGSNIIAFDSLGKTNYKYTKEQFLKIKMRYWYHDLTLDQEGNIYVCDLLHNTIQKFKRIAD